MSHHSGFAGVLSIRQKLAQKILHTYYADGKFNAKLATNNPIKLPSKKHPVTNQNLPDRYVFFDLFLAEPLLNFSPRSDNRISVHIRLNGKLTFSSASLNAIENTVQIDFDVIPSIETFDTGTSLQFGVNLTGASIENFTCARVLGPDPNITYFFDLNLNLIGMVTFSIWGMDTSRWRFTPPGFDELRSLGLITSQFVPIRTFGDVATLGVDIIGLTSGNVNGLIDMLNSNVERGFVSTFKESINVADDEYGSPIYEAGWTKVKKMGNGKHLSNLAFSVNRVVMQTLYSGIWRQMILDEFEQDKQEAIDRAKKKAKDEKKEYKKPEIAKINLIKLNMFLANDRIDISGEADYDGITVTFSFKIRFVRTLVDGSTSFVYSYQSMCGIRPEVYDVDIDTPWWITFVQVIVGVVGVALAPFTFVMSAFFSMMIIVILGSVVSGLLGSAGNKMKLNIAKQLSGNNGRFKFTLPDTEAPEFTLEPDDIVVNYNGIDSWFWIIDESSKSARLKIDKYQYSSSWPVMDRNPIIVSLDMPSGYYHPDDTAVRIRWQVFAENTSHKIIDKDVKIKTILPNDDINNNPKKIIIDHAKDEWEVYEKYIVKCRVYRPWGVATQEIWSGEFTVKIEDRLHRHKPYVRWNRLVFYKNYSAKINDPSRQPLGWAQEYRKYAIHKTHPDERCRFADRYTYELSKDELIYLDALPFAEEDIKSHLTEICEYCFFGGPDKVNPKPKIKKPGKPKIKYDFQRHFGKK